VASGDELAPALLALLGAGPGATIDRVRRLSGGASRETWSFDLVSGDARQPLILQRQRPGAAGSQAMGTEAALVRAAGEAGVPVPEVLATDDGSVLGAAGIVVRRLDGETIPRKLLRDDEWAHARTVLCGQAGAALAAIHRIPPKGIPDLDDTDQLAQYREILDGLGEPHPAFELGFRWLVRNRPAATRRGVVHGDFRLGNLLIDQRGLAAVLDWELAHLGDPVEDLAWFCVRAWRFGSDLPAGGVGTREELVAAYQDAGGAEVPADDLRWWEATGTLKWGVICIMQASAHLTGLTRSVELATIGRRVCENEWDLLALLPGDELPGPQPAPTTAGRPSLHGRPTAAELVEAVREWVDADVRGATEGRVAFHARVASNALRIVERELAQGPGASAAHQERLAALGCADDAELARRIRTGDLDDRYAEVRQLVAWSVRAKLEVANPGHLPVGA
jgi:aminoglycoside phosphotransferase (APT) family kinase protein